jgi:hypothetical protein
MSSVRKYMPVARRRNILREDANPTTVSSVDTAIYVVGYLRVSDIKSARGEISIPDQRERIINFCDEMNYILI